MKRCNPCAEKVLPPNKATHVAQTPVSEFQKLLEVSGDTSGFSSYLDIQSLGRFQQVSKFCFNFTSKPYDWRLRLLQDFGHRFGFKMVTLTEFEKTVTSLGATINYQEIYKHLRQFEKKEFLICFPDLYFNSFALDNHLLLLAVCANAEDPRLVAAYLPHDEIHFWIYVAIIAGCDNAVKQILPLGTTSTMDLRRVAVDVGDLATLKYLLDPANGFTRDIKYGFHDVDDIHLYRAARFGHWEMMQFLMNPRFKLRPNPTTIFNNAVASGNLKMVRFLLDPKFGLRPDQTALQGAACSHNLAMMQFLLEPEFGLYPDHKTLNVAAKVGDLKMVRFLLDKKFDLCPNQDTLNHAVQSGDLETTQFLLDTTFGLQPDEETLREAASSGKLIILQYLLDPKNGYQLRPNQNTLDLAAASGSLEMLKFLLDPSNGFDLHPNQKTLQSASGSYNQAIPQFLLDPANGFNLTSSISVYQNDFEIERRDAKMKSAICDYCYDKHPQKKYDHLLNMAQLSLRHFFRIVVHACLHPESLGLMQSQLPDLAGIMDAVAMNTLHAAPIERETIIQLIEKARDKMCQPEQIEVVSTFNKIITVFKQASPPRYQAGFK